MANDQESEEQIRAATVGNPKLLNGPIILSPYNPEWPLLYAQLERRIRSALGSTALLIEHIGSTAVPGLSAKPIIDIVLAVPDSNNESLYVSPLEFGGFQLTVREPHWFAHRMFNSLAPDGNIHVFTRGCKEILRMILFRDRLRTDTEDRTKYELAKRALAARTWKYVQNYADAKSQIVTEILNRAVH